MSENLNRSNPDFSKYDSMSIGELEEILRADAMGPERDDSDVDEILYVMEVLAKKRRQNGIAGKTALEAYQEFQQHYLPMAEEESKPKRKSNVIPFRRIAAVAASLVLVFSLSITANAFSFRDVWDAVAKWAEETFSISFDNIEINDPTPSDTVTYTALGDALIEGNIDSQIVPQVTPDRYTLSEVIIDETPAQKTYIAIFTSGNEIMRISVQSVLSGYPDHIEKSGESPEVYNANGIDFFIFENHTVMQAVWLIDTYECSISGNLSLDEIIQMLDSVKKG